MYLRCPVCSVIPLVFLQVLQVSCPMSEQQNLEPEEQLVNRPANNSTVSLMSQNELNQNLSSDSSPPIHDLFYTGSLAETEAVPVTVLPSISFTDQETVPSSPRSVCTPAPLPCSESAPSLSEKFSSELLPAEDDSCISVQSQSEASISYGDEDVAANPTDDSAQIENSPLPILVPHSSLQEMPNHVPDILVET